jgi:hypothetical protein
MYKIKAVKYILGISGVAFITYGLSENNTYLVAVGMELVLASVEWRVL